MTSKKIKTKAQALQLLDDLCNTVVESIHFSNGFEHKFYELAVQQMTYMKNSINHSEDFFNHFFKDKTEQEIMSWIEKESEKWS